MVKHMTGTQLIYLKRATPKQSKNACLAGEEESSNGNNHQDYENATDSDPTIKTTTITIITGNASKHERHCHN